MRRISARKRVPPRHRPTSFLNLLHANWTKRTAGLIKRSRISSDFLLSEYEAHFDRFEPAR